jgi:uncharacterized membrane protein YphA (DoxX/SURF4 family)
VALRLGLGCHFLYEGVWKIKHGDEFSAEPFLLQAKGPASDFFYAMLPDVDGRERLGSLKRETVDTKAGKKKVVRCEWFVDRLNNFRSDFIDHYKPTDSKQAKAFEDKANGVFNKFRNDLEEDYLPSQYDEMQAYFKSLDRFHNDPERAQDAPFQKKRHWDEMTKLRKEVQDWVKEIEGREKAFRAELYGLLDEDQARRGSMLPSWNPLTWSPTERINFAVTYGLTAIGVCLVLGLCTRLAALGGACFMLFVVMTQPAWPGIYPPDPPVVGHALLINKDFIEMLSLILISTTAVGRWGGLDFLLHALFIEPFFSRGVRTPSEPVVIRKTK